MQRLISGLAADSNASIELRDRFELPPGRHSGSRCMTIDEIYGAPFVKILYQTDLAQKLLSLRRFSYLCADLAISVQI